MTRRSHVHLAPQTGTAFEMRRGEVLKIIDPDLKNPGSEHWERAFRMFDLVL